MLNYQRIPAIIICLLQVHFAGLTPLSINHLASGKQTPLYGGVGTWIKRHSWPYTFNAFNHENLVAKDADVIEIYNHIVKLHIVIGTDSDEPSYSD